MLKIGDKVKVKSLPKYPPLTVVGSLSFREPDGTVAHKYRIVHENEWATTLMIRHGDELVLTKPVDDDLVGRIIEWPYTENRYKVLSRCSSVYGDRYDLESLSTGRTYGAYPISTSVKVVG